MLLPYRIAGKISDALHALNDNVDLTWIDYSCEVRTVFNDLLYKEDMHAGGFFEFFCCMCQSFHNSTTTADSMPFKKVI